MRRAMALPCACVR
uniref:Uncharacterized protein n=1 Tax=Arundo donax TaxID=35708 RepID=A0A0A9AM99_ARUDO